MSAFRIASSAPTHSPQSTKHTVLLSKQWGSAVGSPVDHSPELSAGGEKSTL